MVTLGLIQEINTQIQINNLQAKIRIQFFCPNQNIAIKKTSIMGGIIIDIILDTN